MNELFPVLSGLAAGALLAAFSPRLRLALGVAISIVLGATATVISGEYKISWEFLLVDIPLVAISATAGMLIVRAWRRQGEVAGGEHKDG